MVPRQRRGGFVERQGVTCGKSSVSGRQFRSWTLAGLGKDILKVLNAKGLVPDVLQMIDSTVVSDRHQLAGAKRGA